VSVQESAGVAGNVDYINLTFLRGSFVGNTTNYGSDYVIRRLGTNHVGARASISVPIGYVYWTGDGGSDIVLNVTVHFTDDRGHQIVGTVQWMVK